ncbi:hypothetical protein [Methanosarcina horonobensis]|uniref:hypothetical protein n=1 Tax=Methanosarcina horonobensis TaxID=418008 RepID=UPI000B279F98|nr:hypothetical protein [Methanosarcina horonobensis]
MIDVVSIFLKEENSQKNNLNYVALNRSVVRKVRAFLYQKGPEIRLHASEVMPLQPVEARIW